MKAMVKFLVVITVLVAVSVSFAKAPLTQPDLNLAKKSYLNALDSDNAGVRNSAMFQIIKLKATYPDENVKAYVNKVKKISENDPFYSMRSHAHLTMMFLENSELAKLVNPEDYPDPDSFFNSFYTKLTENELAMK